MSDHADIVRDAITVSMRLTGMPGYSHEDWDAALAALERLVAERDESREAFRVGHEALLAMQARADAAEAAYRELDESLTQELVAAEAERDRLREALYQIAARSAGTQQYEIARAALGRER